MTFKIWPCVIYSRDFLPLVPSIEPSNICSRATFWGVSCLLLKFDLYLEFLTSVDLPTILIYNLPYFIKNKNLTYFQNVWSRVTSSDLVTPFFKADVKSVILIYNLPTFNELRNLTLNEPEFVIWPQTQIRFIINYF